MTTTETTMNDTIVTLEVMARTAKTKDDAQAARAVRGNIFDADPAKYMGPSGAGYLR